MIQPNLKEVRISYRLDKYRFNIIFYINLFSLLQPKAEWTVKSTLHTQKSFCRAGFCTNNGLLSVIGVQWLYLNKFWTKLLFKKMLPSMLKFVMAEIICADERCFPKVLLVFCTCICLFRFFLVGCLFGGFFFGGGGVGFFFCLFVFVVFFWLFFFLWVFFLGGGCWLFFFKSQFHLFWTKGKRTEKVYQLVKY